VLSNHKPTYFVFPGPLATGHPDEVVPLPLP